MSDIYVMSTIRIDMVIDKGWYVKNNILTKTLPRVAWQKYFLTKLEQHKLLKHFGFLSVDINLKSHF